MKTTNAMMTTKKTLMKMTVLMQMRSMVPERSLSRRKSELHLRSLASLEVCFHRSLSTAWKSHAVDFNQPPPTEYIPCQLPSGKLPPPTRIPNMVPVLTKRRRNTVLPTTKFAYPAGVPRSQTTSTISRTSKSTKNQKMIRVATTWTQMQLYRKMMRLRLS